MERHTLSARRFRAIFGMLTAVLSSTLLPKRQIFSTLFQAAIPTGADRHALIKLSVSFNFTGASVGSIMESNVIKSI